MLKQVQHDKKAWIPDCAGMTSKIRARQQNPPQLGMTSISTFQIIFEYNI
ncbi:hypothetical protein [Rickettsia endosymbiont of Orchestes rusci]